MKLCHQTISRPCYRFPNCPLSPPLVTQLFIISVTDEQHNRISHPTLSPEPEPRPKASRPATTVMRLYWRYSLSGAPPFSDPATFITFKFWYKGLNQEKRVHDDTDWLQRVSLTSQIAG